MRNLIILLLAVLVQCAPKGGGEASIDDAAYKLEIEAWHQKRVESLKGPKGWLNLAGLFWLNDGINTFGSGERNNIIFPAGKIPERAGFFTNKLGVVSLDVAPSLEIKVDGVPLKRAVVFHIDSTKNPVQTHGSLEWFIIRRDAKLGVRLRDLEHPAVAAFHGIERYDIDKTWRLEADFEVADTSRTVQITNVLGQTYSQRSPGTLKFTVKGRTHRLDVLDEGGEEYFVIFGDDTNAKETYGSGRYMYVAKPVKGRTILDFNKAYNPPCAFTEFATCPLPPRQNILKIAVTAGEKNFQLHSSTPKI